MWYISWFREFITSRYPVPPYSALYLPIPSIAYQISPEEPYPLLPFCRAWGSLFPTSRRPRTTEPAIFLPLYSIDPMRAPMILRQSAIKTILCSKWWARYSLDGEQWSTVPRSLAGGLSGCWLRSGKTCQGSGMSGLEAQCLLSSWWHRGDLLARFANWLRSPQER